MVFWSEVFELIQYAPQTDQVWSVPLLMVPPVINKFYIMDIAPGRSMIEYFLRQGMQVFAISWRNPTAEHRTWGFDTYGQAILDALDAVQTITELGSHPPAGIVFGRHPRCDDRGAPHRDRRGRPPRQSDVDGDRARPEKAGFAAAAIDEQAANIAIALSARKGYLDGRSLAEVFAWLRPTDLIWRYWVNNYVEGKSPAAFDVLFWNADTTRMAAALHRDMVMLGLHNALATPGAVSMLGTPVDLGQLTVDAYVVAGIADHISPWQACYRSARLLGSKDLRFVLSSSGHIAALVNPPGNPKASYLLGAVDEPDPAAWAETAEKNRDSWWPDFVTWLADRGGRRRTRRCPSAGPACRRSSPHRAATCSKSDNARHERRTMTTDLEEPADLIDLVGQQVGTTEWMKVTQEQLNLFADATGITVDPHRPATRRQRPVQGHHRPRLPDPVACARRHLGGAADLCGDVCAE